MVRVGGISSIGSISSLGSISPASAISPITSKLSPHTKSSVLTWLGLGLGLGSGLGLGLGLGSGLGRSIIDVRAFHTYRMFQLCG